MKCNLNSAFVKMRRTNLEAALEYGFQSVVTWRKKCLVGCNAAKLKLLSFTYHRELFLPTIRNENITLHFFFSRFY